MAVVAPSGPFEREAFDRGLAVLATRYRPVLGAHLFEAHRYLAGTDEARAADLRQALTDPTVRAVFVARGGYGAARLLPTLELTQVRRPVVGFSDTTALHLALQARGVRSLHGPVLTQLGRLGPDDVHTLFRVLEGEPPAALAGRAVVGGQAEGPLLGGNLSVLSRAIGTPWLPTLEGAVLLLEDVGERPYRLDRMWTHLLQAGVLARVAGVVLGEFTGCDEPDLPSAVVLDELARALGVPCLAGVPLGHGALNRAVPLGARVHLDATAGTLTFLEGLT